MTDKQKPSLLLSALDSDGGPFAEIFDVVASVSRAEDVVAARELTDRLALIIWGGADISPSIYGQKPNLYSGAKEELSWRDKIEVALCNKAIELGIPIIGICRGAQLACAMSGGTLVQHVTGHGGGYHEILTSLGTKIKATTLHHQMLNLWKPDGTPCFAFEKLAWMEKPRSSVYHGEPVDPDNPKGETTKLSMPWEPEVVWIPHTKSLCIQGHPEFIHDPEHPYVRYSLNLVKEHIL